MIELNEPQMWTLIGVFAASTFTMMGLISTLFLNVINARFEGLRGEMNAGFARVDGKIDHLDRDVNALFRRVFPEFPDAS